MRLHLSSFLLPLAALSSSVSLAAAESPAAATPNTPADVLSVRTSSAVAPASTLDAEAAGTVFNGQRVPPMAELTGQELDETISKGYWLVEFYSPYCHHCKALAPIWQTLYEFYYTSNPLGVQQQESDNLNSFTRYYDFKFAKLDCVAFGTACSKKDVKAFPTLIIFKDGEPIKRHTGVKELPFFSNWIEEVLETIRPGSRPANGLALPKPGDHEVDLMAEPEVAEAKDRNPAAGSAAASKLNALASETAAFATSTTPDKPKKTPNPAGISTPLTAEGFQRLVTTTLEPWFIKFYAPWCHHCQAMAPNWAGMARDMQGKLNVGEVNCEVDKRLCKDARVKGYPTMMFFKGGERVEYEGLRGLGDLINFANKAIETSDGVADVTADEFKKMEETEEVIFLYFYDHATTTEDFEALERLTLSLIGHARLVKTSDPALVSRFKISTWPRLLVSRDGKPRYYPALAPKDMRDVRKVLGWMKSVWLPIVPELTANNAREIMDGNLVVLGILSRERSDEFIMSKREIKNAALEWIDRQDQAFQLERQELRDAKQMRIEEAEDRNDQRALRNAKSIRINMDEIERTEVRFAWVDGVFWERWIRSTYGIDVREGERVVINDEDNHRYWDNTITGNPIMASRTSILETLQKVVASPPKISPKSTTSQLEHVFFKIRSGCSSHPWLAVGMLIGFIVAVYLWGRKIRRVRSFIGGGGSGGFFHLDGKEGLLGNSGTNGKVD
ncbi:thioredoxin-like protein [Lineolata rhizophorae]|uniref:Thioredoxin-like protein n=1 Tax=Lineolata rhizophorae TaxID=578093 RepID=A0A6A6NUJ1_9PEZI|nr:thioredoxin-like protein [Lineolata rhizophorae]